MSVNESEKRAAEERKALSDDELKAVAAGANGLFVDDRRAAIAAVTLNVTLADIQAGKHSTSMVGSGTTAADAAHQKTLEDIAAEQQRIIDEQKKQLEALYEKSRSAMESIQQNMNETRTRILG